MTLVQFFYNLDQGKAIAIELQDSNELCFFELNHDPEINQEYPYLSTFQEGFTTHQYGFTKEKLLAMIQEQPKMLEYAYITEIETVEKPTIWQKIKFLLIGRI